MPAPKLPTTKATSIAKIAGMFRTQKEAADFIGVSQGTVCQALKTGRCSRRIEDKARYALKKHEAKIAKPRQVVQLLRPNRGPYQTPSIFSWVKKLFSVHA